MKKLFLIILYCLFNTSLLLGILMQIINPKLLPSWTRYIIGLEFFTAFLIVGNVIIKWVAKILNIEQHEL